MPRRLTLEEPPSRLAVWSLRLTLLALLLALGAVIGVRSFSRDALGWWALVGALGLAAAGIVSALAAFVVIWNDGNPGLRRAVLALPLGAALIAWPATIAVQSRNLPMLADVSTNPADPPRFEAVARERPAEAKPTEPPDADATARQRAAYPELAPLLLAAAPAEVYASALEAASRNRWRVVETRAPQPGRADGRIEAVARTLVMGFREDVIIRVRASGRGAVVDIRSASRFGWHDFGSNAARVRALRTELADEFELQPAATR